MSRRRSKRRAAAAPSWRERLFQPVDIASLVFARIAFGAIMLYEAWVFTYEGRLYAFIDAPYLFTFPGFHWVKLWPGDGLFIHFYVMGALAFMLMVGFLYRIAAVGFFLCFTYFFLLDQARYLNHFYLVCLLAFLMIFVPAHRSVSVDAWLRPKLRSDTVPAWALWILTAQMGIVYFFGGVAKLNGDWLRGYPMRLWMPKKFDGVPFLGPLFDQEWFAIFLSYGGLFLDLLIAPALLWKKTRPYAFVAVAGFHVANSQIFSIGIFPWLAIALTTLFFEPDWPRRVLRRIGLAKDWANRQIAPAEYPVRRPVVVFVSVYLAIQVLMPLRHFAYPENPSWTEEGHNFSWHMKLRSKTAEIGIFAYDPDTGERWQVEAEEFLWPPQYDKMSTHPAMLHQFAKYVAKLARESGHRRVEVRIVAVASLNGRKPAPMIDHTVDLAAEPYRWFTPAPWILPLEVDYGNDWLPDRTDSVAGAR